MVVILVSGPNCRIVVGVIPLTTLNEIFPTLPIPVTGVVDVLIPFAKTIFPGVFVSTKSVVYATLAAPSKEFVGSAGLKRTFVITFGS